MVKCSKNIPWRHPILRLAAAEHFQDCHWAVAATIKQECLRRTWAMMVISMVWPDLAVTLFGGPAFTARSGEGLGAEARANSL